MLSLIAWKLCICHLKYRVGARLKKKKTEKTAKVALLKVQKIIKKRKERGSRYLRS